MRLTLITCVVLICDKFAVSAKPYGEGGIAVVLVIMAFAAFLDVKDAFKTK